MCNNSNKIWVSTEICADLIAECLENLNYEIIINVQGDETLVEPEDVKNVLNIKKISWKNNKWFYILNKKEDTNNLNIPKLVTNKKMN